MVGAGNDDALTLVRERLALGIATLRRPRGLAVLCIRVQPVPASAPVPEVERELSSRIRGCLRASDSLASLGGRCYLVLLERAEAGPFAMDVADRLVEAVGSLRVPGEESLRLAASIGISVHPDDGDDVDELFACADAAAEAAEAAGGNVFGFHSQPMNERAERGARIERALVGALERDEFRLCYQPQIDSRDGTLKGVEALLRFESGALGRVSPDEFIPVLEANGGIVDVGTWVIEEACAQAARWASEGRPVRVGVNVSARQLGVDGFEATIARALEHSGIAPELLALELTESVLVENPLETRGRIESVRRRGVRVALDDFGTGYASLAYIRQFPMDCLKIDRQFVRGLPLDPEAAAITSAIVALARSLRLEIVAEGVEREAEEEFLHSQDCFVVQGFLHARPMFRHDFDTWRRERPWA